MAMVVFVLHCLTFFWCNSFKYSFVSEFFLSVIGIMKVLLQSVCFHFCRDFMNSERQKCLVQYILQLLEQRLSERKTSFNLLRRGLQRGLIMWKRSGTTQAVEPLPSSRKCLFTNFSRHKSLDINAEIAWNFNSRKTGNNTKNVTLFGMIYDILPTVKIYSGYSLFSYLCIQSFNSLTNSCIPICIVG